MKTETESVPWKKTKMSTMMISILNAYTIWCPKIGPRPKQMDGVLKMKERCISMHF